jgi:DNA-binding transcriptional LysR family regulator
MDRLQSMRVFQEVVDQGGFAAAARKLDLTPAAVTRLVSDLEKHLGVRLLQRTTRRLSLTPAGEAYLNRLRTINDIEDADGLGRRAKPRDERHACASWRSRWWPRTSSRPSRRVPAQYPEVLAGRFFVHDVRWIRRWRTTT